jgi:hypothetical protein
MTTGSLNDPNQKPAVKFNEQAYLMLNWSDFVEQSKSQNLRFTQFAQIDHDEPAELNNILFKKQTKYDILLNIKSVQMSYFVPTIRLFKEFVNSSNQITKLIELPLSEGFQQYDFDSILKNSAGRGGGVGVTSFNWTTIGSNMGNKYSFGAELELFFDNIEEITKQRYVGSEEISFADLLIQQKKKNSEGQYNPDYYRVKAIVGWSVKREAKQFLPVELIEEMKDTNIILYLGLHSHEIEITSESTVILKLKFIAYLEALMDSPTISNVFYLENSVLQKEKQKNETEILRLQQEIKENPDSSDAEKQQLKDIEQTLELSENADRTRIYERILNYIRNRGFIKYIEANEDDLQTFSSITSEKLTDIQKVQEYNKKIEEIKQKNKQKISNSDQFPSSLSAKIEIARTNEDIKNIFEKTIKDYDEELSKKIVKKTEKTKIIPYFYLGDLFEAVLEGLYNPVGQKTDFLSKQVKVMLGPITFYDYGKLVDGNSGGINNKSNVLKSSDQNKQKNVKVFSGTKSVVNIADIPISLSAYTSWFLKKIVDPGVINRNFRDFCNDILNDLVIRSLGVETYSFAPRQKVSLVYKTKTLRKNSNRFVSQGTSAASFSQAQQQAVTSVGGGFRYQALSFKQNPFHDNADTVDKEEETESFMFIYGMQNNSWNLLSDYSSDIEKGIRHLYYGNERGLIKSVKFTRQDNPLIRSHNMKLASTSNADKSIILREVYNANVEMMGNSIFEIGEMVYLSPTLFGSSKKTGNISDREQFAKNLGIGGYFIILKITCSLKDGEYNTNLDLRWNAKGDGKLNDLGDGTNSDKVDFGVKII